MSSRSLRAPLLLHIFLNLAGVDNSDTIKVGRAGGADPEGDQPGDLYVIFKVALLCSTF